MSVWERALGMVAPRPAPAPPRRAPAPQVERWARPLGFTVNVPPEMLGDGSFPAATSRRVSRETALQVPAVKRVRDLICGTLGTLPLWEHDSSFTEVYSSLLDQPEEDIARSVTMAMTIEDMLFEGRAWWRIKSFGSNGFPDGVVRLDARSVTVLKNGRVYANDRTGQAQGIAIRYIPDSELIRIDSPNEGLLVAGARAIRSALKLSQTADRFADDPMQIGYFTPKGDVDLDPDFDVDEMLDDFEDSRTNRTWGYVGGGMEAKTLTWNPEQLQLMSSRDYAVLEIARLGGVDPEELGVSTTSRTYANSEQRRLDLIDFTCAAYVTAVEDRLSMADVTVPGHRVCFEYAGFLRSDTVSRMDVYRAGREVGAYDDQRISRIERLPLARVRAAMKADPPNGAGTGEADTARAVAELAQKIYLASGAIMTPDECRAILNRAGAGLSGPMPAAPAAPAPQPQGVPPVKNARVDEPSGVVPFTSVGFAADADPLVFGFDLPPEQVQFKADKATRTVSGLVMPWNVAAKSSGYNWMFAPDSLHWASESRVKLDKDHGYGTEMGAGKVLTNTAVGLAGAFGVARGDAGDQALMLAEDGVYDGFSAFVTFDGQGDGWIPHPDNEQVRYVQSATLRKVALTAMPAFDDARVQSVAATRGDPPMRCAKCGQEHAPAVACPTPTPPAVAPAQFDAQAFAAAFTAGLAPAMAAAMTEALKPVIEALPAPQRQVVPAGRVQSVHEPMIYSMNGQGPSFVRDAWRARTEGDFDARDRVLKFQAQVAEAAKDAMVDPTFAITTGNAGAVVPPGFRPELYVAQLLRGRPLSNAVSRGTIADASPFTIPAFVSSTGATADHVEGVNPSEGSLSVGTITVSPGAVSGLYKITREIADSSNPAIDAIATQAMSESYSQQTEGKVYTKLNGANGVGGVITTGFVPSGAQVATTTGSAGGIAAGGDELLAGLRQAMALYPFRRFAPIDFGFLSQEATQSFAGAVDTTGRPLIPWVAPMNPMGTVGQGGYFVDGLTFQPSWSMTGNAAGDMDVIMGNRNDVWIWESPVLNFRFEERSGPAFVELALFGYHSVEVLRAVGLSAIRHTVTP